MQRKGEWVMAKLILYLVMVLAGASMLYGRHLTNRKGILWGRGL